MAATEVDKAVFGIVHSILRRMRNSGDKNPKIAVRRYADDLTFLFSEMNMKRFHFLQELVRRVFERNQLPLKEIKNRETVFARDRNFNAWGYLVRPASNGKPNRFSVPGKQLRSLQGCLYSALNKDDVTERLLGYSNRADFSADHLVGKIFGLVGYISFAYRNGGEWKEELPVLPKQKLHDLFVDFLKKYAHILNAGEERMTEEQRAEKYMGRMTNVFVRRNDIPSGFKRLERYKAKDLPVDPRSRKDSQESIDDVDGNLIKVDFGQNKEKET